MGITHAVDGFIGPFGGGGGKRLGVGVVGRAVVGEQAKPFAVAAIHVDFAQVEIRAVAAPTPLHEHLIAADDGINHDMILCENADMIAQPPRLDGDIAFQRFADLIHDRTHLQMQGSSFIVGE